MPIFEIVFSSPLPIALTTFWAAPRRPSGPRSPSAPERSDAALVDQLVERLEHQVGVDRARAVADQRREVVHLARLAGLDDDPRPQARALAHEVVVDRRDRQQRRDRRAARAQRAVGEDDDVDALCDRLARLAADALDRRLHPVGALGDRPGDVDRVRLVDVVDDVPQRLELAVEQDRLVEHSLWACSGVSSNRLRSLPRLVARLITISSRIGSIGGLVTCANSCLK